MDNNKPCPWLLSAARRQLEHSGSWCDIAPTIAIVPAATWLGSYEAEAFARLGHSFFSASRIFAGVRSLLRGRAELSG